MKQILVVASGLVHPNYFCHRAFRKLLSSIKGIRFEFISKLSELSRISLTSYEAIIFYFHKSKLEDTALEAVERYIFNGGSLLAVHSASASFKQNKRYFNLLGGKFINHGKIEPFTIKQASIPDSPFQFTDDFTVEDELYIHKYKEDVSIHYYSEVNQKKEPVVWTRELGKGKIAYCSLGHRASVFKIPQVQQIIEQSVKWLAR